MSKIEYTKDIKETKEMDRNYELLSFYQDDRASASANVRFNACELCKTVTIDPNLEDVSRLLRVRVILVNVCPGKEVTVGCIVTDRSGRILAYKSDTFIAMRDRAQAGENVSVITEDKSINCGCHDPGHCIDVRRAFTFILPISDLCSPMDVNVKVIANYTSPCN